MTDPDVIDLRAFRGLKKRGPDFSNVRVTIDGFEVERIEVFRYQYNALVNSGVVIRHPPFIVDASKF